MPLLEVTRYSFHNVHLWHRADVITLYKFLWFPHSQERHDIWMPHGATATGTKKQA